MPVQLEPTTVNPDEEYTKLLRMFKQLAPRCSVHQRTKGIPQLAPQEKQMNILKREMRETKLCVNVAKKGRHALHDTYVKHKIKESVIQYENWQDKLKEEKSEATELDIMNCIAQKKISQLCKNLPSGQDMTSASNARLRRMENLLDRAVKKLSSINTENKQIREEIHRLLVERNSFNVEWNRRISDLMKGKEYLTDITEFATAVFGNSYETCKKVQSLKWKGLDRLNKDIGEMQFYESELNHLAKVEEFLRMKATRRICEVSEKEEMSRQEEKEELLEEMKRLENLLDQIYAIAGTNHVSRIMNKFQVQEIENFSKFVLFCEIVQKNIILMKDVDGIKQKILDQHDINQGHIDYEERRLADLIAKLTAQQKRKQEKLELNMDAEEMLLKVLKGIVELARLAKCDMTPLLSLLGNKQQVVSINSVGRTLQILESEIKSIIQVAYGIVKRPAPTPKVSFKQQLHKVQTKLVGDPRVEILQPNTIDELVPYQPCAYCVEDFIMHAVYERPAVPADEEYIESFFHLDNVNTKFGIFTLTVPAKRHPYRNRNREE